MKMSDDSVHLEGRYSHLDNRVTHLDERVNAMAADVSSMRTSIEGLVTGVKTLTDRVHTPKQTNWIGAGSLVLGLLVGGAGFVQLRIGPVEDSMHELRGGQTEILHIIGERANFIGRADERMKDNSEEVKELWARIRDHEEKLAALNREAGEAKVSRKAIGDFAKDIDTYGTRNPREGD